MNRRRTRGVSLGTIVMLAITVLVVVGFFVLLPLITGETSLSFHAGDIFVALDNTLEGIGEMGSHSASNKQTATPPPAAAFTASPTPGPTPVPEMRFTLCAGGRISFTSQVQKAVTADDGYHFEWILQPIAEYLNADLTLVTFANTTAETAKLTDLNMPVQAAFGLKSANIDVASIGHYSTLDGGMDAVAATRKTLTGQGIIPFGAYTSPAERGTPVLINAGGVSVALLSYVEDISSTGKKRTSAEERVYAVAPLDLAVTAQDISAAKAAGAQVIIVNVSWGKTGDTKPSNQQMETAQALADQGADVILGIHPNAVQTVQILTANRGDGQYHPVLCAYSLGNLFSAEREKRVNLSGLLLHATVDYDPVTGLIAFDNLSYTPTYCWRGKVDGAYRYQVFASNLNSYPDYVDKDQLGVMSRCLTVINEALEGSIFAP